MMSYTASATWSHLRRQQCGVIMSYHSAALNMAQRRGAVLPGHITTVAMFRSGQLGRCCTRACLENTLA
jgi:hypothetical protein